MATSNYDVNLQLALATTAEHEGDLDSALAFLREADRAAGEDHEANAQVDWFTASFHARRRMASASLYALAAVV